MTEQKLGTTQLIWQKLDQISDFPEITLEIMKKLPPELAFKAFYRTQPNSKLWTQFISEAPFPVLKEFYKAIYYRDIFGDHPAHAALKREFLVPILRRAYELNHPELAKSVAYHFREPWTVEWGKTLDSVIDLMAEHHDRDSLKNTAYLLGIFSADNVAHLEPQLIHLIERAAEAEDYPTLITAGEHLFSNEKKAFGKALSVLIQKATQLKNPEILEQIAAHAFTHPTALSWKPQLESLFQAAETLNAPNIYAELARHLKTVNPSGKTESNYESEMRRLLEVAKRTKNKTILEAMTSNLKTKEYPDSFFFEYLDAIQELSAHKALRAIPLSLFSGYDETLQKSNAMMDRFISICLKLRDPESMYNLYRWSIHDRPWNFKKHYLSSIKRYVEEVARLRGSTKAEDLKFHDTFMEQILKNHRTPLEKWVPEGSPEAKLLQNLDRLLTTPSSSSCIKSTLRQNL